MAALEILGNERFDLLINDMVMPKVGGTEVTKAARAEDPNIPVVCISSYTLELVAHEVESIENLTFLAKPFSLKQLVGTVRNAIVISSKDAESTYLTFCYYLKKQRTKKELAHENKIRTKSFLNLRTLGPKGGP